MSARNVMAQPTATPGSGTASDWAALCQQLPTRFGTLVNLAAPCDEALKDKLVALYPLHERPSRVTFAGCFNAGKSTLVNALLGETILASGDLPETGVLCEIRSGEVTGAQLTMKDGSSQPISATPTGLREAAGRYTDSGRPNEFLASAQSVAITVTGAIPGPGITWVDTPGIDDASELDETVRATLGQTDLLVWVLASRQLLSMTEADFLAEHLVKHGPHSLVLVINVFLAADTSERWQSFQQRLTDYRERIQETWNQLGYSDVPLPPLISVSARGGLEVDAHEFGVTTLRQVIVDRSRWDHPARLRHAVYASSHGLKALTEREITPWRNQVDDQVRRQQDAVVESEAMRQRIQAYNTEVKAAVTRFVADVSRRVGASQAVAITTPSQADLAAPLTVMERFHTAATADVRAAAASLSDEINSAATRFSVRTRPATTADILARITLPAVSEVPAPTPTSMIDGIMKQAVVADAAGKFGDMVKQAAASDAASKVGDMVKQAKESGAVSRFRTGLGARIGGAASGMVQGAWNAVNQPATVSIEALTEAVAALATQLNAAVARPEAQIANAYIVPVPSATGLDQRLVTLAKRLRALELAGNQLVPAMEQTARQASPVR
jgi:predicted GTPase